MPAFARRALADCAGKLNEGSGRCACLTAAARLERYYRLLQTLLVWPRFDALSQNMRLSNMQRTHDSQNRIRRALMRQF